MEGGVEAHTAAAGILDRSAEISPGALEEQVLTGTGCTPASHFKTALTDAEEMQPETLILTPFEVVTAPSSTYMGAVLVLSLCTKVPPSFFMLLCRAGHYLTQVYELRSTFK